MDKQVIIMPLEYAHKGHVVISNFLGEWNRAISVSVGKIVPTPNFSGP
jgi:hypothetical protein